MAIFAGGLPNLKGIKYFDLLFCPDHSLTVPNICAKFERNRRFELYHPLPGFLMGTLLRRNPQEVRVTCGQKPSTKIIYSELKTSIGLSSISSKNSSFLATPNVENEC